MTHVPDAIITEVLEAHVCNCNTYDPSFENEVASRLREKLIAEGAGESQGQERQNVTLEVHAKYLPIAKEAAEQRVYEDMRSEEWNRERALVMEELKKELMPALRQEAAENIQVNLRKQSKMRYGQT